MAQVNAEPGLYSFAGTIYAPPIPPVIPTPLPPAFALYAAGLGMMAFFVRRKKTRTARAACSRKAAALLTRTCGACTMPG